MCQKNGVKSKFTTSVEAEKCSTFVHANAEIKTNYDNI